MKQLIPLLVLLTLFSCKGNQAHINTGAEEPEKPLTSVQYAKGFSIKYFKGYKIIDVYTNWPGQDIKKPTFHYILYKKGQKPSLGKENTQYVEVPVKSIISLSSLYVAYLDGLGLSDCLKAVDDYRYISTPSFVKLIDARKIQEVGSAGNLNIEKVLSLAPDLVFTYGMGDPKYDSHPKLIEAGVKVAVTVDHLENTPLGRAEWVKFLAAFFDRDQRADSLFESVKKQYLELADLGRKAGNRPTVFTSIKYGDGWYMPGGDSYAAALLKDAGANYLWADAPGTGSLRLGYETVFSKAVEAEYWINTGEWKTREDVVSNDSRNKDFKAFKTRMIFNNNARLNKFGGNDYWESGLLHPEDVLADLISIFHPGLLPSRPMKYYKQLSF